MLPTLGEFAAYIWTAWALGLAALVAFAFASWRRMKQAEARQPESDDG